MSKLDYLERIGYDFNCTEHKTLEELCKSGKCGLCCFKPFPLFEEWDKEFLINYMKYTNFKIRLKYEISGLLFPVYACSYLEIETRDDTVKKMLCSIYPKEGEEDNRFEECSDNIWPVCTHKELACMPLKGEIKGITINNKDYSLNKEIIEYTKKQK